MNKQHDTQRIIRMKEVTSRTGMSKSSIYDRINQGDFPKSVPLGGRSVGWIESEVQEWITERISKRDSEVAA